MSKNLNVNLTFTANTQQAKMQIRDLQTSLNSITSGVTSKVGLGETITQDLQKANQAAMQLKVALRSATDVKTGNIDLYKLDQIFKANKMSVEQYRVALQGAGAEGQKAFAQLNQAITNAQMPIRKTSTMIDSMWTTMKNTMRWQLTSSMLMGFTSAIRKAYGYAKDLNESLNNIRIVTGYNVDKMDKFALSANKAAKALNTTTTAYTDAALIYYQQGLSDEEVLKRTNVTVKLANVSRESAETVSEWMTSIWNNFDDGTKTLEHYADVMTALGAATASSSDEIATGIEKFSAVAKNVGLSYEYAASALATVTAQTRQSADVVGTAFKTLFTRITDLELGKGLDDGTTLGQYSQTLSDIGVNIKTSTGELRDMDAILNDLGARWDNLNKATQQAVAQSVAGIRQSNQFIALMDNWDFFQQNLQTSINSQGALQEQADIYAESWEAASKRVTAAAEGLYDSILDDDFFIEITNGFADLIEFVEMAVDAMGGLKGLLPGILALMLQLFGNKMLTSVREFSAGLKSSGAAAEKVALGLKADSAQAAKNMAGGTGPDTQESMTFGTNLEQQGKIQEKIWSLNKNLTETEKTRLQNLELLNEEQRQLTLELSKQQDALAEQTIEYKKQTQERKQELDDSKRILTNAYNRKKTAASNLTKARTDLQGINNSPVFSKRDLQKDLQRTDFSGLYNSAAQIDNKYGNQQATQAVEAYIQALNRYKKAILDVTEAEKQRDITQDALKQSQDELTEAENRYHEANQAVFHQSQTQKKGYDNTIKYLNQLENSIDWGQTAIHLASGLSQVSMAISSIQQLGSIWKNEDLELGEKLIQTLMSSGMVLTGLIYGYKSLHSAINLNTIEKAANTIATKVNTFAQEANNKAFSRGAQETNEETIAKGLNTKTKNKNSFGSKIGGTFSKLGTSLAPIAPLLVGIGVAIAAIATSATIIKHRITEQKEALENTQQAAKVLKKEYEDITNKTIELKDNIDKYKDSIKTINDLTKGTLEFKEALLKSNEQALKLIENYSDLKYEIIDGQIIINQASMDQVYEQELDRQEKALALKTQGQIAENQAQINYNISEVAKNMYTTSDIKQAANTGIISGAGGATAGAAVGTGIATMSTLAAEGFTVASAGIIGTATAAGSTVGSSVPVIGTIIGAIIGLIIGGIVYAVEGEAAKQEEEALNRLSELYKEDPTVIKDRESIQKALEDEYSQDIIDGLKDNFAGIQDLIKSNAALETQNAALNTTIANSIAKENNAENYSNAINAYINSQTINNDDWTKTKKKIEDKINEEDNNLEELYGEFYDKNTSRLKTKSGNKAVIETYNASTGEWVEGETISQDSVASMLVTQIANTATQGDTEKLERIKSIIGKSGSGTEVEDWIDDITISKEDIESVISRAEANAAKLVNSGFNKEDDKNIINMLTGQLEGDLKEIDFSSLTREQLELIKQNQELWKSNSELNDKIQKGISEYEVKRTEKNLNASIEFDIQQNESNELDKLLSKTETTATEFKTYQKIIQNEYKVSESNAYGLAKANLMVQSSITDLNKKITDNSEILNKNNKNNAQYAKAVAEISTAMTSWLGVELDSDFVEEHMEKIKAAAEGDKQAIKELQDLASQEFVINLDLQGEYENQLLDFTNTVNSTELTIGMTLDTTEATKNLGEFVNKMIRMGQMTTEKGVAYLQSMGFEVDEDDMSETELTTSELWKSDATLWEKIKGTFTGKSVKTINMSSVQYTGEGKTADLSEITEKEEKKNRSNKKKYSDEIDRYHEIKEVMSDLERQAERLAKSKERAFGADKLALMDKEIAKQKELLQTEKDYLSEIDAHYAKDRTNLLSKYAVNLDEIGRITNYEEVYKQQIDRLNSIGEANDWEGDAYEKQKEAYEQFKKDIQQYEETLNLLEEQQQAVIDKQHELADLVLEKIDYKVQIKVDIADDDKAYLDFLMQKVEDDAFAAAEAIGYLGKEAALTLDKIKANEEGIAEVERALAAGEITPEQAVEKMREYRDELVDLNADLLEIRQTVQDKLTEAFEGWNEEIERGIAKLEHYGSVLDNYKNIIDIVGKDMLGISDETMSNLSKAQIANANDVIRATKAQLDANNSTLEKMRQARAEAETRGDEESIKEWDEQIKVAEEKSQELATTLQEALSNGLQLAADDFALTVEQIADSFSKAVSGVYDNIGDMREGWDRMQEVADRYLETYEKTYEISKLNRKIQDNIDKTDSIASQKELRDLQNEMYEMTKDGQQLSKYDLEYLQKKYDLLVAEQAFKDAQNAKSVVRLQRDSEGNFGYVYTADQGTVDNAQQNYEDKLYAFQEYTHKMDEELAEMYISVQEQAYERMQAAAEMYGEGTEAFERERQKILEQYNIDMGYITDEYEKLTGRNLGINERFNAGVADTYKKTFLGQIYPNYETFESLYNETTTQCEASCTRLNEAITLLQQTFDKQLELAGWDLEGFEKTTNKELKKVQEDSSTTADKVEDMADRMDTALNGTIDAVEKFQIAYSGQMKTIRSTTDLTIQQVNDLIKKYGKLAEATNKDYTLPNNSGSGTYENTTDYDGPDKKEVENTKDLSLNKEYVVQDISVGTKETRYKVDDKWYTLDDLNAPNQGHTVRGDVVTFKKNEGKGSSTPYNDFSLRSASLKTANAEDIRVYDESGKHLGLFLNYINEDNLKKLQNLSIVGYKKIGDTNLYKLSNGFYGDEKYGRKTYWLNQTDLHQLMNQVGKEAFYKRLNLQMLDTGGYTGSWGPEGRLAMLHQKEIVLNAHDTENFLTAIGIVRDISDQIEKNAIVMQYQNQLANYRASFGNSSETLQQEVHITAEFPNATDHNEIEEAFKNLTNLASQYANRKF